MTIVQDITKDSDFKYINDEISTKEDTKGIDGVDPLQPKDQIYVKILWSENEYLEENAIFTFDGANDLFNTLTELKKSNRELYPNEYIGYDKTKFELHFNKECTDKFYTGRFDIGDGFANDLREHIYKCVDSPEPEVKATKEVR